MTPGGGSEFELLNWRDIRKARNYCLMKSEDKFPNSFSNNL